MRFGKLAIALCLGVGAPLAFAQSFFEIISGTEVRTTTAANHAVGAGTTFVVGRLRSVLDLAPQQQAFVSFSVVDSSTPGTDYFSGYGSRLESNAAPGTGFESGLRNAGLLDFGFGRGSGGLIVTNANNASWLDGNFGILLAADRRSGLLLFEDARLGSDFDYDDLVLRFQMRLSPTAPVPEPASIALAAAGLGVLALVRRRRAARDLSHTLQRTVTAGH